MSTRNRTIAPPPKIQTSGGFGSPGSLTPSPAPSTKLAVSPGKLRELTRLDTLHGQFTALVVLCVVLAAIGLTASAIVLSNINSQFNIIINDSAPSITTAQRLGQTIQDADAKAADYQLASRVDVTSPDYNAKVYPFKDGNLQREGLRNEAWNSFLQRRQEVTDLLARATVNITYPGEREAITVISNRFLEYVSRVSIMRYELDMGNREAALAAYKSAHDVLVGNLGNVQLDAKGRSPDEQLKLKNWEGFDITRPYLGIEANLYKLTQINQRELDKASTAASSSIGTTTLLVTVLCLLLVLGLGFLCFRSATVTHRLVNPGYGLALVAGLIMGVVLLTNLSNAAKDYNTVAIDSFTSIDAAAKFRQLTTDANGDESRLLLSPESPGLDSTNPALTAEVRKAFTSTTLQENFDTKQSLVAAQVKRIWANITYSGEQAALCKVVQNPGSGSRCRNDSSLAMDEYLKLDKSIRDNFKNGLLAKAIELNVTDSNKAFDNMDAGIKELSTINERAFDQSACNAVGKTQFGNACNANGLGYINLLQTAVLIVFPLIALATLGGFILVRHKF